MRARGWISIAGACAFALVLSLGVLGEQVAAQARLLTGGSASNFGRAQLRGGFMPDPFTVSITSGGNLDATSLGLPAECRGFVTRQPDFILDYEGRRSFLRIYFLSQGDTTLIVNDGAGNWRCGDDSFGTLNPSVDLSRPPSGQYDIWVGSFRAGENVRGTLHVTELRTRHP
jgi:hypothetical protein